MTDEFGEIKELREKFLRAAYDLRDPRTRWANATQIAERMGLEDPRTTTDERQSGIYSDIAIYYDQLGYIQRIANGYLIVAITARGIQYVEGDLERQAANNVTFNIGTADRSIIGTQDYAQLEANINFENIGIEIERRGGEDKEALREALQRIEELIQNRDAISRGELAEFSEVMERNSWFTGAVAQALVGFATQAITGGLTG